MAERRARRAAARRRAPLALSDSSPSRCGPARPPPARASSSASSSARMAGSARISLGAGLLAGGAQRSAAVIHASVRRRPSSRCDRRRLVREAGGVERSKSQLPLSVAREHAAGAIAAVRRRREADEQEPRAGIAEARQRARPVRLAAIAARRARARRLAVRHEPRAAAAADDLGVRGGSSADVVCNVTDCDTVRSMRPAADGPDLAAIEAARARLGGAVYQTPCAYSADALGADGRAASSSSRTSR